jgi:hypothetical protein
MEKHRLRVFENRVLGRIFRLKRDDVSGGWKMLHNMELHSLHSSRSNVRVMKSRRIRWTWHIARMDVRLVIKPERKRPLGRPRDGWEKNES